MRRKLLTGLMAVIFFVGATGCFSFVDWSHNKRHMQAWNNRVRSMHASFDRFFMDYDWDDPTLDIDEGY